MLGHCKTLWKHLGKNGDIEWLIHLLKGVDNMQKKPQHFQAPSSIVTLKQAIPFVRRLLSGVLKCILHV